MSAKIVKAEKCSFPACRLLGRRYTEADRQDGSFAHKWGEWFAGNLFAALEHLPLPEGDEFYDGAYIGAMRMADGEFEYWIGMFFPEDTAVPEGFESVDLPAGSCALLWICGNEASGEIYGMSAERLCQAELDRRGWRRKEGGWHFERYNCPRFTNPDAAGDVILDYGIPLE